MKGYSARLLSGLLAGILVFSLAACGGEGPSGASSVGAGESVSQPAGTDDALTMYKTAVENIQGAMSQGAFRCHYVSDMVITTAGASQNMNMSGDLAVNRKDGLQLSMVTKTAVSGVNLEMAVYCDGATVYASSMGSTVKQALDENTLRQLEEQIASQAGAADNMEGVAALEQSVSPDGKGGYVLQFTLEPSTLNSVSGLLEGFTDGTTGTINSMTMTASIDPQGLLTSVTVKADMEVAENGEASQVSMTLNTTYTDVGGDFAVEAPDSIDMENADETQSVFDAA